MRSLKEIILIVINTYRLSAVIAFQVALWVKCDRGADARTRTVSQLSVHYNMEVNCFGPCFPAGCKYSPHPSTRVELPRMNAEDADWERIGIGDFRSENLRFERVRPGVGSRELKVEGQAVSHGNCSVRVLFCKDLAV